MPYPETYLIKATTLKSENFNPRNYDPVFLFVKNRLNDYPKINTLLTSPVRGGSTPPYWFFQTYSDDGIPFVKTSEIRRDIININELYFIKRKYHEKFLKRSITRPFDVIYSMTGKFMGKAALCPPQITELNMSQNSVVFHCKSSQEAAFLCIYLNSSINQRQVKGSYSITKQKYINQTRIGDLKTIPYNERYKEPIETYLKGLERYYSATYAIRNIINEFNLLLGIPETIFNKPISFSVKFNKLEKLIMTPQYYHEEFSKMVGNTEFESSTVLKGRSKKGNEIGSINYLFEGIPVIKTSDLLNFDIDYQPNYYCSEEIYKETNQDLRKGDILFTKDGKIGETALLGNLAKAVISSGVVRLRPESIDERYWWFLVLSSNYGKVQFEKWTVIASTMAHLRREFLENFRFPSIEDNKRSRFIKALELAFQEKWDAYATLNDAKNRVLDYLYEVIGKSE
jgi:type I restriction enzyme S subunit